MGKKDTFWWSKTLQQNGTVHLLVNEVCYRFGTPRKIISNRPKPRFEIGRAKKNVAPTVTNAFKNGDSGMLRNFGQSNAMKNRNAKFLPLRLTLSYPGNEIWRHCHPRNNERWVDWLYKQGQTETRKSLPAPLEPKRYRGNPRTKEVDADTEPPESLNQEDGWEDHQRIGKCNWK